MKLINERQLEIINAALDIIADHGIQRLTVKNLARSLKVSEPALYRHFKSKYDIILSILVLYNQVFMELFDRKAEKDRTTFDKISSLYGAMFRRFVERPALSTVIFSEELFRYEKRLSVEVIAIIEMTHDRIFAILRDGARRGEIRSDIPSKQIAWMVMGTMRLLITKWRISGYSLNLIREGQQMLTWIRKLIEA